LENQNKIIKEENKKKVNICIGLSDLHIGNENCLFETLQYCIDKLIDELDDVNNEYDINEVYLILNGDVVSGSFVYRNQYLENQIQKNESVILTGAFLLHEIIEEIEEMIEKSVKVFMTIGNHEGSYTPHPENFVVGISRRLCSYGHDSRYASGYLILNIAHNLGIGNYNVCAFHSWGGADYSSASPSVIREMTRAHSQLAIYKGIIIQRFLLGHTHWLEVDRSVLGIRFDVTGGFQKWDKTISNRESGLLYYMIDEEGEFEVNKISGLKKQLEEERGQDLHTKNSRYIADLIDSGMKYEIKIGLLKELVDGLELR